MIKILKNDIYYNIRIGEKYTTIIINNREFISVNGKLVRTELIKCVTV